MTEQTAPEASKRTDVLFYHLERQPLEAVLPALLEKTLERGWRAVVQVGSQDRLEAIDEMLWTYRADSFLPHGRARDGQLEKHHDQQPIILTTGVDTPNGARVRFLVEGTQASSFETLSLSLDRIVILFDGTDPIATQAARVQWKAAKAAGAAATYWQQNENGRWEKRA